MLLRVLSKTSACGCSAATSPHKQEDKVGFKQSLTSRFYTCLHTARMIIFLFISLRLFPSCLPSTPQHPSADSFAICQTHKQVFATNDYDNLRIDKEKAV